MIFPDVYFVLYELPSHTAYCLLHDIQLEKTDLKQFNSD